MLEISPPGKIVQLSPLTRRIVAPNGSRMTGPGTNAYLIGTKQVALIDPGPVDETHMQAILKAGDGRIRWILVTHTHSDHSPGAAFLSKITGAELVGMPPPNDPHQDLSFSPDRMMAHGQLLQTEEFTLEALYTPGHVCNHLCYLLREEKLLMTGDHIMNGSTVVIIPPHGVMVDYLASLELLKSYDLERIAPGHGNIMETPHQVAQAIINHRLKREQLIINVLKQRGSSTVAELTPPVYRGTPKNLFDMAEKSLLAHLIKLETEQRAAREDDIWRLLDT